MTVLITKNYKPSPQYRIFRDLNPRPYISPCFCIFSARTNHRSHKQCLSQHQGPVQRGKLWGPFEGPLHLHARRGARLCHLIPNQPRHCNCCIYCHRDALEVTKTTAVVLYIVKVRHVASNQFIYYKAFRNCAILTCHPSMKSA